MRGRVKFFLKDKNYGFIIHKDIHNKELETFVHGVDVEMSLDEKHIGKPLLQIGDFVEFEMGDTPKGKKCAKKVRVIAD